MNLYLDIETLPAPGEKLEVLKEFYNETIERSRARGTYKNRVDKNFDTYFKNTSFQGEFGRIFCIGYATDNDDAKAFTGDEKKILQDFWDLARGADLFIGHNVMDFDLRFIYKRSVVRNVKPTQNLSFARYRNSPIFDTMREWEKWGAQGVSLHKLCVALSIGSPKEEGIDGSKVYDYFLKGKGDEIIKYCKRDVEATREVYKKMNFL